MDLAALILGVLSVGGAIWALLLSREQTSEMRKQVDRLDRVQNSLFTRYLGPFPACMPEVISSVDDAKQTISIMCDCTATACWSAPAQCQKYRSALFSRRQDSVEITLIRPTEEIQKTIDRFYFSGSSPEQKERRNVFVEAFRDGEEIDSEDLEQVAKLISKIDSAFMTEIFNRGTTYLSDARLFTIDSWIFDGASAVFAVRSAPDASAESTNVETFFTRDKGLVDALKNIQERHRTPAG